MYQRLGKAAYKADLSNTHLLMEHLNSPQQGFKSVHVAGTNGKGSVSHMLASVFQEAGYKVGLYTSPHLRDFRERIKINGNMIPKRTVSSFVSKHKSFFESNALSFFEMTVGLAFDYFRREKVDIAIIEVGLGGRLDSTNVILPEVSVITNIGMDHMQFLGNTLPEIAAEKAGILKKGIPVVIGETVAETKPVFIDRAKSIGTEIIFAEELRAAYKTDLKGWYQKLNLRTAEAAIQTLKREGWKLPKAAVEAGLNKVVENTGLLGRWQTLGTSPTIVCDTAHNREGLMEVMKQLAEQQYDTLYIVLGTVSDKDLDTVLPLFPKEARYYFCKAGVPRSLPAEILATHAKNHGLTGEVYDSVKKAFDAAKKAARKSDFIYVGGSTFVVAEVV